MSSAIQNGSGAKPRGRAKRIAKGTVVLLVVGVVVAWMCFQHIPAWYQPVRLSADQAETVRRQLQQTYETASQKMVAGEAFSLTFTALQINEMLSAQQVIWPAATQWLDPRLSAPSVNIKEDRVTVGMRCRWGQVQSVLSLRLALRGGEDDLAVSVVSAGAGSLRVPVWLISKRWLALQEHRPISAFEKKGQAEAPASPDAAWRHALIQSESISLAGTYRWPNGGIPYKISGLDLHTDRLTLHVLPLSGADSTRLTTTRGR